MRQESWLRPSCTGNRLPSLKAFFLMVLMEGRSLKGR